MKLVESVPNSNGAILLIHEPRKQLPAIGRRSRRLVCHAGLAGAGPVVEGGGGGGGSAGCPNQRPGRAGSDEIHYPHHPGILVGEDVAMLDDPAREALGPHPDSYAARRIRADRGRDGVGVVEGGARDGDIVFGNHVERVGVDVEGMVLVRQVEHGPFRHAAELEVHLVWARQE